MIDFTPLVRSRFVDRARRMSSCAEEPLKVQTRQLRTLLQFAFATQYGQKCEFERLLRLDNKALPEAFARTVPQASYDDLKPYIMRMLAGGRNVLWPGRCCNFAQSSGTSGGKTKYIPITPRSLKYNHYAGASDSVAAYLALVPDSRLFSGKALILGGSFATELPASQMHRAARVGDLSATLISRVNPLVNLFRIPSKRIALLPDWEQKLPLLAEAAARADITNLSGVPSWALVLLRRILQITGASSLHDIWPHFEVFFHGGIAFSPYRSQYAAITDPKRIRFIENYNASEGFFAVQNSLDDPSMLLLLDRDVYYEFAPYSPDAPVQEPLSIDQVRTGEVYRLLISASNGLWRYDIGDTVEVTSLSPLKIRIAGRTKCYINAFGEEVMQHHADAALLEACRQTGASVADFTVAPLYATEAHRGRHQWLVEWNRMPSSIDDFARILDSALCDACADYQAKRAGSIFLSPPQIVSLPAGSFSRWLAFSGNCRLGGQRKIPRLSNDRSLADSLLSLTRENNS